MASDANRTMTAQESSAFYIKVTSSVSLTATRNLIAPAGRFPFTIENATTGGQAIQIIGPSGTGVTIPSGATVSVWNDGTNYVQSGTTVNGLASITNISALRGYGGSATTLNVIGYYSGTPDGGGGTFVDIGAPAILPLVLTAAGNASGGSTVYTGTLTGGGSNSFAGLFFTITGFSTTANNGVFLCTASSTTTFTLSNGGGTAETHAGTATSISTDDGGVTIYDSVSGHNWARLIPEQGQIDAGWFGVVQGQSDTLTQHQNALNYMCSGSKFSSLIEPNGIFPLSGQLSVGCNFIWQGQGIVGLFGNRHNGTMLEYTGGAVADFIKFDQGQSSTFQWSGTQIRDMEFRWAGTAPTTWTNAIGFYTGSPLNQGGLYNVQFTNWTGAQLYQHVTLPSSPTSVTGYISDGTGSGAGRILCLTSGSASNSAYVSGSGIAPYTFVQDDLVGGSIYALTCTGPGGGHPYLLSGSNLNISSETMAVGQPDYFPYLQGSVLDQIHDSGSAQFLGHDPYGGPVWNGLDILHYNHENAQTISAGVAQHYIDLSGMQLVSFSGYNIYEGATTSSPNMFGIGGFSGISLDGIYIENGSPSHPLVNVFDVMYSPIGGGLTVTNSFIAGNGGNQVTGHTIVFEPYVAGYAANFPYAGVSSANIGNAQFNSVNGVAPPSLLQASTYSGSSVNSGVRCGSANQGPFCPIQTAANTTYLDAHGQWLDGLKSSMVSLTATGTNKGMVTDGVEGRVFEIQATSGGLPSLNILLNGIPPDLYGQQIVITVRWKFSGAGGYVMCPVYPSALTYFSGDGGIFNFCTPSLYSQNTWYTSYLVGLLPSASSTSFQSLTAIGGSAPSGTTTLDIASINVSFGNKPVYTTTGQQSTKPITWPASAPPTYGAYIVGDTVINSAPTANGIIRWVNTVAGSQGTFSPVSNNPVSTFGFPTLVSGTTTVSTAAACTPSATCAYTLTNCGTNSSTALGLPTIGTVSAGTSFVINSEGPANTVITADVSKICWRIN